MTANPKSNGNSDETSARVQQKIRKHFPSNDPETDLALLRMMEHGADIVGEVERRTGMKVTRELFGCIAMVLEIGIHIGRKQAILVQVREMERAWAQAVGSEVGAWARAQVESETMMGAGAPNPAESESSDVEEVAEEASGTSARRATDPMFA